MKKLPVPENIPLRRELWKGFGKSELIPTSIITLVAIVIAILFYCIWPIPGMEIAAVMAVIFVFAFCICVFGKLENNQSIYDYLKRKLRYKKDQQIFWCYYPEKEACILVEDAKEN